MDRSEENIHAAIDAAWEPNLGRIGARGRRSNALPMESTVDRVTITRVEYSWGKGTDDDMVRRVVELHDDDGVFLRYDPGYPENTVVRRVPRSEQEPA